MTDPDTRLAYLLIVLLVALERLYELGLSRRHLRRAVAAGGVEAGAGLYPVMVVLHTAFLLACPLEVWLVSRPFVPALGAAMAILLLAAMALRYWAVRTLGERWTTRVVWVPGRELEVCGPYRWLRHPNYLAVVLEFLALPLLHGAWVSALVFSLANGLVLQRRIADEERLLAEHGPYDELLGSRRRLWPGSAS